MKIDIKDIREGKLNGEQVWICDFRYNRDNISNSKPIRHVKPKLVLVRSNTELPNNKRIYYSSSHFVELNKKGEPINSKIIPLFDNTGYRFCTGIALNVFNNESECVECYNEQCNHIKQLFLQASGSAPSYYKEQIDEIDSLIIK